MLYMDELSQDKNSALFIITTLSPMAKESVEMELYRQTADSDGSTDQYVLEDAFLNLYKDLENIGITLNVDYSEYCQNMDVLFSFLRFCSILLPNSLYDLIKTNDRIKSLIENIVLGNLGDNETYIQIYLSEIGGLDGNIPIFPEMTDYIDDMLNYITQTNVFSDYFKNLLVLINEERVMIDSDEQTHQAYIKTTKELIGRMSDAVNKFELLPYYSQMCNIENLFIKDLTSPCNFHEYTYIFLESVDTIPEDLIEGFKRKLYYYKISHPWSYDYYKLRNKTNDISPAILAICYCTLYTFNETKSDFEDALSTMNNIRNKDMESIIFSLY